MPRLLTLHNTLTNRDETFAPLTPGEVSFYTCGPTVYDFAHIGNFRSFLAADLLRRWLESPLCRRAKPDGSPEDHPDHRGGYRVTHVMNITDVGHMVDDDAADGAGEDKMEAARKRLLHDKKTGKLPDDADIDPADPYAIARFYADAFVTDAKALGLKVASDADQRPELMPRPTGLIPQMLEMILALVERGHAYIATDGVAYFDTQSFPDYGCLSGNTPDKIRSGAGGRVSEAAQSVKKHPADFMLWKPDPTHLMRWDPSRELGRDVPLGEGYPGWHLECSVMAAHILGETIDLHSGGEDNIFPHHECEIAQSRCAHSTDRFARFWFHPRFLMVAGEKMSKSKGTFFTARDLFTRGFAPDALRLELIKTHYRSNANFTEQGLVDSARQAARWRTFRDKADASDEPGSLNTAVADDFADAMNSDLNISRAIGVLNSWIADTPAPTRADAQLLRTFDRTLGVLECADTPPAHAAAPAAASDGALSDADIDDLLAQRQAARDEKNFARADEIRDQLTAAGVEIKDAPTGATWSRKASLS